MSTLSATNRSRQKVLGYPVDVVDLPLALSVIDSAWQNGNGIQIVTLNAEMVIAAQQDTQLDRIIRHAHLIVPDGAGVVWAVRLSGEHIDRLPGIELAEASLALAAKEGKRVALIGATPETMTKLQTILKDKFKDLHIVAAKHGYFSAAEEEGIINEVAEQEPDLILVALGVPRQEYFIDKAHTHFAKAVMIGVGGSFDIWAGNIKRAPILMRRLHLEWLYRLITQPWRLKRMGSSLPRFSVQVAGDFLRSPNRRKKRERRDSKEDSSV